MMSDDPTAEPSDVDDALRRLVGAPPVEPEAVLQRVAATRLEQGAVLDETFVIEHELGRGGMGVVFLARHDALGRNVAIKLCSRQQSPRETERLRREAQAIAALAHPNVVVVHHVGTVQDRVYVVMEHVDGGTLRTWLGASPRAWREVVDMFVQAGRGLEAAHAEELVHRDFKPDNVLIGQDGRARVCDFGLAAPLSAGAGEETHDAAGAASRTTTGGTPRYMAPEQHAAGPVTPAADQFSWCVALWEALSGEHPFAGANSTEIACSIVVGRRRTTAPRIPRRIRRALERGLATDPAQRHPSFDTLLRRVAAPGPRTELWLGLGAVVGVTALALSSSPNDPCAAPKIQPSSWSQAQRTALSETLSASPLRAGAELFVRTEAAVDAHWEQWRIAEHAACRSASGDPRTLEPVHACLEVNALRMSETLAQLEGGEPDVLARALELVDAVGSPAECNGTRPTGRSARVAGIASGAREAIIRSQTALVAGDLDTARSQAQQVLDDAQDNRAAAEAELVLSSVASKHADFDLSAEHGERGLALAIGAGADDVSARVAAQLVYVEAQRGQLGLAERWYGRARAWSVAVGDPTSLRVHAWLHWGLALRDARRFDEAERVLREALGELRDDEAGGGATEVAVLAHLGSTLRAMGRFDEADVVLREADAVTVSKLGVDHPRRIVVLISRQVLALKRQRLDESLALGNEALQRVTAWVGADSARAGELHVNIGNVLASAGRLDEAAAKYAAALQVFEGHGNLGGQRRLVHNLAQLALVRGDPDTALRWARREIELLESLDQPDYTVIAYSVLSHIHSLRGELDAAAAAINRAVDGMDAAYGADDPQRAIPLMALGRMQLQRNEDEAALATLERAAALLQRDAHGKEHVSYDTVELYRGHALVRLGRYAEALVVAEALVARPLSPGMEAGGLYRLVAETRAGTGDHEGAFAALDTAVAHFRESDEQTQLAEAEALRRTWAGGAWPGR